MVLAVMETVMAQFIFENVSRRVAVHLDVGARIGFPATFWLIIALLCLPVSSHTHMLTTHAALAAFIVTFASYVVYEARYWPELYIRRNIREVSGAQRHREHSLIRRELQVIFDLLAQKNNIGTSKDGFVGIDTIVTWFVKECKSVRAHRDTLHALCESILGEDEFSFPTFESEFGHLLTSITLMLHGHIVRDRNSNKVCDLSRTRSSLSMLMDADDGNDDHEGDIGDEAPPKAYRSGATASASLPNFEEKRDQKKASLPL
jgi:hypothetical protein